MAVSRSLFHQLRTASLSYSLFVLLALPASTNYQLKSFEFGGGGADLGSTNYALEGIFGETIGEQASANYQAWPGLIFVQQANTPRAPTFENTGNWYNKLKITINTSNNPSDASFAVAISDDNWATTNWVQDDNTVGSSLGIEDFQTYTNWGGASGEFIIGLSSSTTYKVRVKARQGLYTESPLGPEASAATVSPSLSFDIDVSSVDEETSPPYQVDLGDLALGSVTTASDKIWIDLATNAEAGGYVYLYGQNSGLLSSTASYTISALTGNLASQTEGFGVRGDSVSESSGGPLALVSPYDGAADNVGTVDTTIREILSSSSNPITGGRSSILVKAKPSTVTPAAADYVDTITMIASSTF